MTDAFAFHRQSNPAPLRRFRSYHLALTAIALGVHAMSASAQTDSEPPLGAAKPTGLDSSFALGLIHGADTLGQVVDAVEQGMSGASFSGVAQDPQRVEIRQAGQLIRSTVVPAGPFTLTNLSLIDRTSKVEVTTVDCNGGRHTVVVDAASLIDAAPIATGSYAPQGVVAEQVLARYDVDSDDAVSTSPIDTPKIGVTSLAAEPFTSEGILAEQHRERHDVGSGDIGHAPLAATTSLDSPSPRPSPSSGSGAALHIQYQPIALAARYALSLPVDSLTAYAKVVGAFGRKHLARGSVLLAASPAPQANIASLPFSLAAVDSKPLPLNVINNLLSISKGRARVVWSRYTRAPESYSYSSIDAPVEADRARQLPGVWSREFARANMPFAGSDGTHDHDGSGSVAYAAEAVSPSEISDREWNSSDLALASMGYVSLIGGALPYEPYVWAGDTPHAGEPALRLFAKLNIASVYARS